MWSPEEQRRLKKLRIAPVRHDREKLIVLVNHFKENGSVFGVTGKGLLHDGKAIYASQDFARKLKRLTEQRKLDWLVGPDLPRGSEEDPEQAERGHWRELRECAKELRQQVHSGAPFAQLLGFPWATFPDCNGSLIICAQEGDESISLSSESSQLFDSLLQHLPDHKVWDHLAEWCSCVGRLRPILSGMTQAVTQFSELKGKTWVPKGQISEVTEGLTEYFCPAIALEVAETVRDLGWVHREYPVSEPQDSRPGSLQLVRNRSSFVVLAVNPNLKALKAIKCRHARLLEKALREIDVSELTECCNQLERCQEALGRELDRISHLVIFPGICSLYTVDPGHLD